MNPIAAPTRASTNSASIVVENFGLDFTYSICRSAVPYCQRERRAKSYYGMYHSKNILQKEITSFQIAETRTEDIVAAPKRQRSHQQLAAWYQRRISYRSLVFHKKHAYFHVDQRLSVCCVYTKLLNVALRVRDCKHWRVDQ